MCMKHFVVLYEGEEEEWDPIQTCTDVYEMLPTGCLRNRTIYDRFYAISAGYDPCH